MKRLFAMLLAAVMLCTLFAGCQNSEPTPSAGNESTEGNTGIEVTTPTQPEEFRNTDKYPLEGEHKLTMGVALENAGESYLFGLMSEATGVDIAYQYVTDEQAPPAVC